VDLGTGLDDVERSILPLPGLERAVQPVSCRCAYCTSVFGEEAFANFGAEIAQSI
jgi:hypothetical protein